MPTGHICFAHVDCEQATLRSPGWTINPIGLLIGRLMFQRAEGETRVIGKNLAYTLPVRDCGDCAAGLTNGRIRLLVEKAPLYAQLLAKWPRAKVSVNVR